MPEPTANRATAGGNAEHSAVRHLERRRLVIPVRLRHGLREEDEKRRAKSGCFHEYENREGGESIHVEYCTWEKEIEVNESVRRL